MQPNVTTPAPDDHDHHLAPGEALVCFDLVPYPDDLELEQVEAAAGN